MQLRLLKRCTAQHRPFSSSARRLDAVDLAYTRHDPPRGDSSDGRSPILLMHGLFGSQRTHRSMSKVLAKDLSRPVYALDLRNHGDTAHHSTHTYNAMAVDVETFISAHSIPSPILIGHSMGAKVAMTLALRQPHQYSALIPVDNAPIDAVLKSDFGKYVQGMKEVEDTKPPITKQSDADKILQKYESDLGIRQFLLTNFVKTSKGQMRWRIPLTTLAKSLPDMADFPFRDPDEVQFKGPTLIVRGTKSHYVADESLPLIGRFFPRFKVLEVESGHWVMSEKFEEFRSGVVEWVENEVDDS